MMSHSSQMLKNGRKEKSNVKVGISGKGVEPRNGLS